MCFHIFTGKLILKQIFSLKKFKVDCKNWYIKISLKHKKIKSFKIDLMIRKLDNKYKNKGSNLITVYIAKECNKTYLVFIKEGGRHNLILQQLTLKRQIT